MTPLDQQIAIAELCGWNNIQNIKYGPFGIPLNPTIRGPIPLPDYLHDLNAMHEAVAPLLNMDNQGSQFILHLWEITGLQRTHGFMDRLKPLVLFQGMFILNLATAAQRAEAFLRVKGRWVE